MTMNRSPMTRATSALAACLVLFAAHTARAQDIAKPLLLVASPELEGPYRHTALIVVPTMDRHIGFIINRATTVKLATLFPDHPPSAKVADPVYIGGPEASGALFAMLRRDPGEPSVRLFGDLFVTGHAANIDRIIEQTPNEARYFAGFVGWEPGELAGEIEKGYWYVADPDAALVFRHDTGVMWDELVKRFGNGHAPGKHLQEARQATMPHG